uniref:Uncharacterized protein n=1 Tax=Chromera velia CCMP2878 TaxID=1169474 RepID=A0A0G4GMG1_9ALVE|eukprot:Cvel_22550.t1-p1 / transcript=Cvel_22550.t1 / gene=Cvel_22550 / organism=Chromera_velia_CCMP2878 / gene_product=hypothetical protein / transcript_product=hypothetical protein / location=Cvel_scaffold2227:14900-16195(+) / protein_length=432 / sequence_SO=supercontig / SO=protein_coding / is_pseudo=false
MRKRADAVLRSLSQSTQDVWSATLISAQLKDPDVLIQKLTEMCKTVHGDESTPWKGGLAPKKQGDIRAVVKEEIALFVGGGMGLPRKEKPNNTHPPKKSNNSSQPKGNPISNSEKKCWHCGRSSCKNPSTCESLKEGNECKCCGRLGHWKPTCRCSKCMAEKNAAPPKSKKKQTVNHVRGDPDNLGEFVIGEYDVLNFRPSPHTAFDFQQSSNCVTYQCTNCRHDVGRAMVDTGTKRGMENRGRLQRAGVLVREQPYSARVGVAKRDGDGCQTSERIWINVDAISTVILEDETGRLFHMYLYLTDDDVSTLVTYDACAPFDRLGETPSYFDVRDVRGIIHRVTVDALNGHCYSHIPSFPLPVNAKKREAEFDREWGGGRQALCVQRELRHLDMEEARVEHNRLGIHSGAEYFRLTLEEDGKSITAAMAAEIL